MTFCVGLTGGIGCGKSRAADLFAELGATVVDTDVISRELTGPAGAAMEAISAAFGPAYILPDGSLDRSRMRSRRAVPLHAQRSYAVVEINNLECCGEGHRGASAGLPVHRTKQGDRYSETTTPNVSPARPIGAHRWAPVDIGPFGE